jgi:hypothetical protein
MKTIDELIEILESLDDDTYKPKILEVFEEVGNVDVCIDVLTGDIRVLSIDDYDDEDEDEIFIPLPESLLQLYNADSRDVGTPDIEDWNSFLTTLVDSLKDEFNKQEKYYKIMTIAD